MAAGHSPSKSGSSRVAAVEPQGKKGILG
jgi:hypothetical protein